MYSGPGRGLRVPPAVASIPSTCCAGGAVAFRRLRRRRGLSRAGSSRRLGVAEFDAEVAAAIAAATPIVREHAARPCARALARDAAAVPEAPRAPGEDRAAADGLSDAATAGARRTRWRGRCRPPARCSSPAPICRTITTPVTARALDAVVIDHVSRFDADGLQRALDARPEHACGGGPAVAVMRAARAGRPRRGHPQVRRLRRRLRRQVGGRRLPGRGAREARQTPMSRHAVAGPPFSR